MFLLYSHSVESWLGLTQGTVGTYGLDRIPDPGNAGSGMTLCH